MKILEDLKREKEQQQSPIAHRDDPSTPSTPPSEATVRAIEALYAGLSEFADGLNQLDAEVRVSYEVESMGTLRDLLQTNYKVEAEDSARPRFVFSFECVGKNVLNKVVDTLALREQIQAELQELGIAYSVDDMSTWRYSVTVKPIISVRLLFSPSFRGSAIRLDVHNLRRLGIERFTIQPSQVSVALINEIGMMILGRKNRFAELIGNTVSEEIRNKLRARVQSRQQSRAKIAEDIQKDMAASPGRVEKLLRGGDETAAAAQAPSTRRTPRQAPVMVTESIDPEGYVDWNSATPDTERARAKPATAAADAKPVEAVAAIANDAAEDKPVSYAWMITHDVACMDTAGSIARRGPNGSASSFPVPLILRAGEAFRLKGKEGNVRYTGKIVGQYQGVEPLVDFGLKNGCYVVEYKRDGKWVRVRPSD